MNIYESEEKEVKKLKSVITEFSQESQVVNSWEGSFTGGYLSSIGFAEVEISSESPLDRGEYLGKEVTIIVGDDEPEVLSQEFIDKYKVDYDNWMPAVPIVHLQNLLVPKKEEVDQAYKDGYEIGKKHAFEKAGLEDKDKEPETVASVIADFYKSLERLKEVLGMEVEEIDNV